MRIRKRSILQYCNFIYPIKIFFLVNINEYCCIEECYPMYRSLYKYRYTKERASTLL